jgi:hypothetical protein
MSQLSSNQTLLTSVFVCIRLLSCQFQPLDGSVYQIQKVNGELQDYAGYGQWRQQWRPLYGVDLYSAKVIKVRR